MRFRTEPGWLARLLRGRRLDRNPLRRGSDRAETIVLGVLLAGFLGAAPFAAHAAGSWGYGLGRAATPRSGPSLVQVTATLLRGLTGADRLADRHPASPPRPGGGHRTARSGPVSCSATADVGAGHTTRIWVGRPGRPVRR